MKKARNICSLTCIETRQDDGQHIANFLIAHDQTGFETVFKGDDCVGQFGTWLSSHTTLGL